jgi:hypothetical protein
VLNARVRAETALDTKKFVSELQGHAAFAGCTALLPTSAPGRGQPGAHHGRWRDRVG